MRRTLHDRFDPRAMMGVVQNTELEPIGNEAAERLLRALNSL